MFWDVRKRNRRLVAYCKLAFSAMASFSGSERVPPSDEWSGTTVWNANKTEFTSGNAIVVSGEAFVDRGAYR